MRFLINTIIISLLVSSVTDAQTPEEKGLEIAKAIDARDTGWGSLIAQMEMTLKDRRGRTSTRKIETRQLEVEGDGDKSLSLFKQPLDVEGTAMLTFTHGLDPDDQWLYLPAIKRVKRISSQNRSGPFMGSEFAFEDLASQEVEKYTYKYLRDEDCGDGLQCTVSQLYPAYENSGYSRQLHWVDKTILQPIKIEYYDRKNSLLKTLSFNGYQQYNGYWRADQFVMENHINGKKTILNWLNYQLGVGLNENDFNHNALKRLM